MPNFKETKVVPYEISAYCSTCTGVLRYTGNALLSKPAKYMYKCDYCKTEYTLPGLYPKIEYRGVDYA